MRRERNDRRHLPHLLCDRISCRSRGVYIYNTCMRGRGRRHPLLLPTRSMRLSLMRRIQERTRGKIEATVWKGWRRVMMARMRMRNESRFADERYHDRMRSSRCLDTCDDVVIPIYVMHGLFQVLP